MIVVMLASPLFDL